MVNFSKYLAVAALGTALTVPFAAQALTVKFEELTGSNATVIVNDGDALDSASLPDAVGFSGFVGAFRVSLAGGSSADEDNQSKLRSFALSVKGGGENGQDGKLRISISDTGYTAGGRAGMPSALAFAINGTELGGSLTASAYVDTGNQLFGMSDMVGSELAFMTPASPADPNLYGDRTSDRAVLPDEFSMTTVITLTQKTDTSTQFDATQVAAVPIPAAGLLLLGGLGGLGGLGALKRRKKA
jgi:hypothetical protein